MVEYWLTQDCVGGSTVSTQDCVVRVLVDTGLCGGCTVSTQDCVVGVLVAPRMSGWSIG